MYTDDTPIPFGRYKFTALKRLPPTYLIGLNKNTGDKELQEYITKNLDQLSKASVNYKKSPIEQVSLPCGKITYPKETDAKKHMHDIQNTGSKKKPVRTYYCNKCGGWHLTSKPLTA